MSIRPFSLAAVLLALAAPPAPAATPFAGMARSAEVSDAAYLLGLCSRHMGRGPADAVLARYNSAHPQGRDARARSDLAFNEIYRRGQGEASRAPIERAYCSRQVTAILKKFGAG